MSLPRLISIGPVHGGLGSETISHCEDMGLAFSTQLRSREQTTHRISVSNRKVSRGLKLPETWITHKLLDVSRTNYAAATTLNHSVTGFERIVQIMSETSARSVKPLPSATDGSAGSVQSFPDQSVSVSVQQPRDH